MAKPPRDRSAVGKLSRRKGCSFELVVRDEFLLYLRDAIPGLVARRSSQAERAHEADVILEGDIPRWLADVWCECQHSKQPDPPAKLEQAERDCDRWETRMNRKASPRIPIVVWREHGRRALWLTARLRDHLRLIGADPMVVGGHIVVTSPLSEVLRRLRERATEIRAAVV